MPTRDLLVIHPDLDYAQSLGAVMGTLPNLHPDVAVSLVEQVTPRPRRPDPVRVIGSRAAQAVLVMLLAAVAAFALGPEPAAAAFGPTWQQQMEQMEMTCQPPKHGMTTCTSSDADKRVVRVVGYRREQAALYLIEQPGMETRLLVFDRTVDAINYVADHPDRDRAGRVVIW